MKSAPVTWLITLFEVNLIMNISLFSLFFHFNIYCYKLYHHQYHFMYWYFANSFPLYP